MRPEDGSVATAGARVLAREALASDAEIVSRVRAGDRALFEVLIRRHNPRVYRAIRAILRDEADVEDAMQQTYLLAYSHLADFEGASSFTTWLTRIAVNEALGSIRKRVRLVRSDNVADTASSAMPTTSNVTPEDGAAGRESVRILERAIDSLPANHRMVLMLREIQQMTTAETAEALGISEEAVRIRLHRAKLALRDAYAEEVNRGAEAAFPFHAPRCDRIVAAVMGAILADVR